MFSYTKFIHNRFYIIRSSMLIIWSFNYYCTCIKAQSNILSIVPLTPNLLNSRTPSPGQYNMIFILTLTAKLIVRNRDHNNNCLPTCINYFSIHLIFTYLQNTCTLKLAICHALITCFSTKGHYSAILVMHMYTHVLYIPVYSTAYAPVIIH